MLLRSSVCIWTRAPGCWALHGQLGIIKTSTLIFLCNTMFWANLICPGQGAKLETIFRSYIQEMFRILLRIVFRTIFRSNKPPTGIHKLRKDLSRRSRQSSLPVMCVFCQQSRTQHVPPRGFGSCAAGPSAGGTSKTKDLCARSLVLLITNKLSQSVSRSEDHHDHTFQMGHLIIDLLTSCPWCFRVLALKFNLCLKGHR